jgi:hypothetical protein
MLSTFQDIAVQAELRVVGVPEPHDSDSDSDTSSARSSTAQEDFAELVRSFEPAHRHRHGR